VVCTCTTHIPSLTMCEACSDSPYMHFAADRAMREMNRKEKEIIKAYLKAVKYASQLESRVRIMLIGDGGSGGYVVCLINSLGPIAYISVMRLSAS